MNGTTRLCGLALLGGGALLILINTALTPLMPLDESDAVVRASTIYLVRLSVSGVDALLLLLGTVGVYVAQREAAGAFGTLAFLVAFVGTSLLVAVEWTNVFVLRPVAQLAPEALDALGDSTLMIGGFASALSLFGLGWLLLAVSAWRARVLDRWAAIAVVAGLLLTTALTPVGLAGAIAGSVVLGAGLMGLGRSVMRARRAG